MDEPEAELTFSWDQIVAGVHHLDHLEEEAKAQRRGNWGDETCCTYSKGYFSQPIYACNTCSKQTGKNFGFCFGCSQNCHLNHDVIELFDKRHFRCDCPTQKETCELLKQQQPQNTENKYNHNFDGLYCWCNATYNPDTDSMLQCFFCQDWFHETCINKQQQKNSINSEDPFEFVCSTCTQKYNWLTLKYPWLEIDSITEEPTAEGCKINGIRTKLPANLVSHTAAIPARTESIFFKGDWRTRICQCDACLKKYAYVGLSFLTNEPPTRDAEENEESISEEATNNNTQVDPIAASNAMHGLGNFKQKLHAWLVKMNSQGSGTVVTEEAVKQFLKELKEEAGEPETKKRKLNDD